MWLQRSIQIKAYPRGFHLITQEVLAAMPELANVSVGMLFLNLQHTSASLSLNENADPDVREDLETAFNTMAPEDLPYVHTIEGPDDMPAHVKSAAIGTSLSIPISKGGLVLGTWQGITLGEHRESGGRRTIFATLWGES